MRKLSAAFAVKVDKFVAGHNGPGCNVYKMRGGAGCYTCSSSIVVSGSDIHLTCCHVKVIVSLACSQKKYNDGASTVTLAHAPRDDNCKR